MKSKVTRKGQIRSPLPIRRQANLIPGTPLDFQVDEHGNINVRLTDDISKIKGMVKSRRKKSISLREMKKAIFSGAEDRL